MAEALFNDAFLKKIELLYLVSRKIAAGTSQATRRARRLGAGIDVADYREYSPGDDLRHVDWNYYASSRELLVRLFEEEEDLHIYFLVDASPSMRIGNGDKDRYARRVAAALAYIGLSNLDRVSIVPFGESTIDILPPSRGRSQIWKVFEFLSRDFTSKSTDLLAAAKSFVGRTGRRGLVTIVSDFYDPRGFVEGIDYLRFHRCEPLIVQIWDEAELNPALHGDIELADCETGQLVRVTATAALLERYRLAHAELRAEVESYCRRKDVLYFAAPTSTPFDDLVLRVFRAGGFLR